nr:hypothetical protein [Tanacetum cinerariifolium]
LSSPPPRIPFPALPPILSPPSHVLSPTPLPSPIHSLGYRAAMIRLRAEAASTSHSPPMPPPFILSSTRSDAPSSGIPPPLPISAPTSSPSLQLPSASRMKDRPEVTLPPRKRLGIVLGPRYEVGESSSAAAARPTGGLRADYGFVATMDNIDSDVVTTETSNPTTGIGDHTTGTGDSPTGTGDSLIGTGYRTIGTAGTRWRSYTAKATRGVSPVIHQPPQEISIQEIEDLKQQYLDEMKRLINSEYHDEIKIAELKENFNESDEFIKSSVENLIPIPSESEDDILRETLLNVNLLFAKIEALNDNPTPFYDPIVFGTPSTLTSFGESDFFLEEVDAFLAVEDEPSSSQFPQSYLDPEGDILLLEAFLNDDHSFDFKTKSSSTSLNSLLEETKNFDNSLPEFTTFSNVLFDAEYESESSDDQSCSDEYVPEEIFSTLCLMKKSFL